ncbi:MAG: 6,7-dimethyl-8-ribityllumazine synthase [Deltaproteobacteria bacterium]|nr:6,7-dimethyl-8-ribityllumazine synthase [Deltaproteobacteria bacterium]
MVKQVASRKVLSKEKRDAAAGRKKIAIVVSQFNQAICDNLLEGCIASLKEAGYQNNFAVFNVAGAFEIPLMAKRVLQTKKYAGVVVLGCVIRGDTPHFEYISLAVTMGCQQVQLDTGFPVAFGVITVNNKEQALERSGLNEFNKGREAVMALLDSLATLATL